MASTSHSLLEQLQAGPQGLAWERFHSIYEPLIHNWLRSHHLLASDRDDVTQNVLTIVVQKLPGFQHNLQTGAFRKWLRSISINCLRDYWKKQKTHPKQAAADQVLNEWADDQSEISQRWDAEYNQNLIRKLLQLLQPEFKPNTWKAFEAVRLQQRPVEEVGKELDMSLGAIHVACHRVMTRLRQEARGLMDEAE
jgi:RNA polymerase sigma-70 factor (ECF subfamily)